MYYFYVLYSLKDGMLYKGSTYDVGNRYLRHTMGSNASTRYRRPLVLIYVERFEDKTSALKFERYSKGLEGGVILRKRLVALGVMDTDGGLKVLK